MANNNPADDGGWGYGTEHVAQIVAEYNQQLGSLVEVLLQLNGDNHSSSGPANISGTHVIMLICAAIKIIRRKLLSEMGRQSVEGRFQLVYALIALVLGYVEFSLLIYILLDEIPWLVDTPWVLLLVILFIFIAN